MKRHPLMFLAALVAVFSCPAVAQYTHPTYPWVHEQIPSFDPSGYGYPAEVVSGLRAQCYNPWAVIGSPMVPESAKALGYLWLEPRNYPQDTLFDLTDCGNAFGPCPWNYSTVSGFKGQFSARTFGQWLSAENLSVTRNPYYNAANMLTYLQADTDWAALRAQYVIWYGVLADAQIARAQGPSSYQVRDLNGLTIRNAAGYVTNQPSLSDVGRWTAMVVPMLVGCSAPVVTPTPAGPTPTPAPNVPTTTPTPTLAPTPTPSGQPWCRNTMSGVCAQLPALFGSTCPAGYVPCGPTMPTPTPTPPLATPTAVQPTPTAPPSSCAPPCVCVCPTPAATPPPTSTPTPTPTPPAAGPLMCRNPETGQCLVMSPIFGVACPAGWAPCAGGMVPPTATATPTPTPTRAPLVPRPVITKFPSIAATFWYGGSVIYQDGAYTMWVTVNDGIFRLTSADGVTWGDMKLVLWATEPWEDDGNGLDWIWGFQHGVSNANVLRLPGGYVMAYTAGTYINTASRGGVGLAYSADGITWTKEPLNPVYRTVGGETYALSLLAIAGTPYFYFSSTPRGNYRIALDDSGRLARLPERTGYYNASYPVAWEPSGCWMVLSDNFGLAGVELSTIYREGNCTSTLGVKLADITGAVSGHMTAMLPFLLNRGPDGRFLGTVPTFLYSAGDTWATWQLKAVSLK